MIKVFSSDSCPPCTKVEDMLKKNGIEYEKIDVNTKKGARIADREKVNAIPTLITGSGKKIVGFRDNLMEELTK